MRRANCQGVPVPPLQLRVALAVWILELNSIFGPGSNFHLRTASRAEETRTGLPPTTLALVTAVGGDGDFYFHFSGDAHLAGEDGDAHFHFALAESVLVMPGGVCWAGSAGAAKATSAAAIATMRTMARAFLIEKPSFTPNPTPAPPDLQ